MHITRLRLLGFKSFVDPTELVINAGLTGVVGPNGCGKSNLLEALRWVMGETSYKSMRAAAMDDVIFSGSTARPARNMAEVGIFIDNTDRTAPAEFNDSETLEIVRRIEREAGSAYRINGREVRAKDVKILFEDAATGARSPALVRQGQIGEIVNAKPEQRRRILEDAAGIAGLHSRRHDAELRLKAAEGNLTRISDILGQMSSQVDGLKRQARQAKRYRELSEVIRGAEAAVLYLRWVAAHEGVAAEEAELAEIQRAAAEAARTEAVAIKAEAEFAERLQPLRQAETETAAALARLLTERDTLTRDLAQAETRLKDLDDEQTRLAADFAREEAAISDANEARERLKQTIEALETEAAEHADALARTEADVAEAEAKAATARAHLSELTRQREAEAAERRGRQSELRERQTGAEAIARRLAALVTERTTLEAERTDHDAGDLTDRIAEAVARKRDCLDASEAAAATLQATDAHRRECEEDARDTRSEADALTNEVATLSRLLATADAGD
ncbi:MAG: AAA family ATPase, partial [Pseudomonadota bacterium]